MKGGNNDTIRVGLITRAVGVRGETAVKPLTDDVSRFRALARNTVFIETPEESRGSVCVDGSSSGIVPGIRTGFVQGTDPGFVPAVICGVRFHKGQVIVKFDACEDAKSAASLRGKYISITRDMLVPLSDNSFYVFDLIGCRVINTEGAEIGTLCDVLETGSNDVYVVKRSETQPATDERTKGGDVLLPAIKSVIMSVDIKNKRVVADMSMFGDEWR